MRNLMICFFALFVSSIASANEESSQQPQIIGEPIQDFAPYVVRLDQATASGLLFTYPKIVSGAKFIRMQIFVTASGVIGDTSIRITDSWGQEVERISLDGIHGVSEIWTSTVPGDRFKLEIMGHLQAPGTTLTVQSLVVNSDSTAVESIFLPNDLKWVRESTDQALLSTSRAIGRVEFQSGLLTKSCTAFLISASQMVTNYHCLSSTTICKSATVDFDYLEGDSGLLTKRRRCTSVQVSSGLDLALFMLDKPADSTIRPLAFAASTPVAGTGLILVGHPEGLPKRVVTKDCAVINDLVDGAGSKTDFSHQCDSLTGSSGAPVLDSKHLIVGLHHLGKTISFPSANRAVRVEEIRKALIAWGFQDENRGESAVSVP